MLNLAHGEIDASLLEKKPDGLPPGMLRNLMSHHDALDGIRLEPEFCVRYDQSVLISEEQGEPSLRRNMISIVEATI